MLNPRNARVLLFAGLALYIFIEMKSSSTPARSRQSQTETWRSASAALDDLDYDKATEIAQRLTDKNPTYYYGYYYLGYIALERNHLKEAEAISLAPTSFFRRGTTRKDFRRSANG